MTQLRRATGRIAAWAITRTRGPRDESGQGLAEYALIITFIALVSVAALGSLGGAIASSPGFTTLRDVF